MLHAPHPSNGVTGDVKIQQIRETLKY